LYFLWSTIKHGKAPDVGDGKEAPSTKLTTASPSNVSKSSSLLKIPSTLSPITSNVNVDMGNTDSTDEHIKSHPKKVAFQICNFFLSKSIPTPKAKPELLSKTQERKFNTFFKI
jgi:hypothetical protein